MVIYTGDFSHSQSGQAGVEWHGALKSSVVGFTGECVLHKALGLGMSTSYGALFWVGVFLSDVCNPHFQVVLLSTQGCSI